MRSGRSDVNAGASGEKILIPPFSVQLRYHAINGCRSMKPTVTAANAKMTRITASTLPFLIPLLSGRGSPNAPFYLANCGSLAMYFSGLALNISGHPLQQATL
jgi:hypothetical protein